MNDDMVKKLEDICGEFDFLLQEGVILTRREKENMLKIVKSLEIIIREFDIE